MHWSDQKCEIAGEDNRRGQELCLLASCKLSVDVLRCVLFPFSDTCRSCKHLVVQVPTTTCVRISLAEVYQRGLLARRKQNFFFLEIKYEKTELNVILNCYLNYYIEKVVRNV